MCTKSSPRMSASVHDNITIARDNMYISNEIIGNQHCENGKIKLKKSMFKNKNRRSYKEKKLIEICSLKIHVLLLEEKYCSLCKGKDGITKSEIKPDNEDKDWTVFFFTNSNLTRLYCLEKKFTIIYGFNL